MQIISKNKLFYLIIFIIIFLSLPLFYPKFSSTIFKIRNKELLNNFINKTIDSKKLDSQAYWQMREFYCPGYFVFKREENPFLTYRCPWLNSQDFFTNTTKISELDIILPTKGILISTENLFITKNNNKLIIVFILPISEMKKANGFFDYKTKDQILMEDKFWFNQTAINL